MIRNLFSFIALIAIFLLPYQPHLLLAQEEDSAALEETLEDELETAEDEATEEEPEEEEEEEEELEPEEEEEKEAKDQSTDAAIRKIVLDSAVTMSYLFENSADNFAVKYHFHIEGKAAADTAVIKGEAEIRSEVEGFLSKGAGYECALSVTIPKVPFEMTFRKTGEEDARLKLRWKANILEQHKSTCNFGETSKPFETTGNPEKWLTKALSKARPPLRSLRVKLDERETTTNTFTIKKQVLRDPPLGTAEIEGTGVITISTND